ncbi:hypothetical protein, partial [Roseibium sediminis]|uniref:hypothetical protein n=1 Tax=Roseibium sediminis TaxID=1775174 RepID=UPI00195B51D5
RKPLIKRSILSKQTEPPLFVGGMKWHAPSQRPIDWSWDCQKRIFLGSSNAIESIEGCERIFT